MLRIATREDAAEIWRVRYAVTENTLTPGRISEQELFDHLETFGRGWVAELAPGRIAGFAIGDARDGNIWALFVDPAHQGAGHGLALHDAMVGWLFSTGLPRLSLGTQPDSRADAFYRRAGWRPLHICDHGERRFELVAADWKARHA